MRSEHELSGAQLAAEPWATEPGTGARELPDPALERFALRHLLQVLALACGMVGLVYAWLASPAALALNTGALERLATIQAFYAGQEPAGPSGQLQLVLGDSIAVGAVDCAGLDAAAGPGGPESFNLGMPAKSNPEYLLDAARPILSSARVIVLLNPLAAYAPDAAQLEPRRANMLRLLDYPLDEAAWRSYARLVPDAGVNYLFAPRYVHVFDSRWRIRTHLEQQLKLGLPGVSSRTKRQLAYLREVYVKDLKYGALPTEPTPAQLERALRRRLSDNAGATAALGFDPPARALTSYGFALEHLAASAQSVVLVLAPLHPVLRDELGAQGLADCRRLAAGYASPRLQVVDFMELLGADGFGDDVHLSRTGADKLTMALARVLAEEAQPD